MLFDLVSTRRISTWVDMLAVFVVVWVCSAIIGWSSSNVVRI